MRRVILTGRHQVTPILSTPPQPPTPVKPLTTRYTPAQTMALLSLRKSDLTKAVLAKLEHGTARPTPEALAELVEMRLARRYSDMTYALTPHGQFMAGALVSSLARELGVELPRHEAKFVTCRSGFQPGYLSQNGNW